MRTRPTAIVVNLGSQEDFPELTKHIKSDMDGDVVGNAITGIRKTKSGDLLIEIRGDENEVNKIKSEVSRTAGDDAKVMILQQRTLLEIRDIDAWAVKEDIIDFITRETSGAREAISVISLRSTYGSTQTALVLMPTCQARGIVDKGRLRVSLVSCRVWVAERKLSRCFRCLTFGHMSGQCKGPDRITCCRRCGEDGHKAADCSATELAVSAFARVV